MHKTILFVLTKCLIAQILPQIADVLKTKKLITLIKFKVFMRGHHLLLK